jgi:glycosyltransferase involved in cell wall biosynthesis
VSEPLVSVVIAVKNGERYLHQAVASVLEQSYEPVELIVVDDGSEDSTTEILRSMEPTLRWARQEPAGTFAAINRGVRLSSGAFLAFLDADDLWTPAKLERQMALLAGHPELDLAFGHVRQFQGEDLHEEARDAMPGMSTGTMLIRRDSFDRVGDFSTEWQLGGFVDWYARAREQGLTSEMLPEVVMLRRLHGWNTTLRSPESRVDYTRIARAALRRRRAR